MFLSSQLFIHCFFPFIFTPGIVMSFTNVGCQLQAFLLKPPNLWLLWALQARIMHNLPTDLKLSSSFSHSFSELFVQGVICFAVVETICSSKSQRSVEILQRCQMLPKKLHLTQNYTSFSSSVKTIFLRGEFFLLFGSEREENKSQPAGVGTVSMSDS